MARKPSRNSGKEMHRCEDGPFEGYLINLTTPSTLTFSVKGEKPGKYVQGKEKGLKWQEK